MTNHENFKIFWFFSIVAVFSLVLLMLSSLFSSKYAFTNSKASEYECGFEPFDFSSRQPFHVHFYLVGILFVLFDVEIAILFPWAFDFWNLTLMSFHIGIFFVFFIIFGLFFEWKKKAIDWSSKKILKSSPLTTLIIGLLCDPLIDSLLSIFFLMIFGLYAGKDPIVPSTVLTVTINEKLEKGKIVEKYVEIAAEPHGCVLQPTIKGDPNSLKVIKSDGENGISKVRADLMCSSNGKVQPELVDNCILIGDLKKTNGFKNLWDKSLSWIKNNSKNNSKNNDKDPYDVYQIYNFVKKTKEKKKHQKLNVVDTLLGRNKEKMTQEEIDADILHNWRLVFDILKKKKEEHDKSLRDQEKNICRRFINKFYIKDQNEMNLEAENYAIKFAATCKKKDATFFQNIFNRITGKSEKKEVFNDFQTKDKNIFEFYLNKFLEEKSAITDNSYKLNCYSFKNNLCNKIIEESDFAFSNNQYEAISNIPVDNFLRGFLFLSKIIFEIVYGVSKEYAYVLFATFSFFFVLFSLFLFLWCLIPAFIIIAVLLWFWCAADCNWDEVINEMFNMIESGDVFFCMLV